ncbi:MAG: ABC transporter permease [Acholeplasmatales bacterium]|jgi:oligopeptide transport system permease protein|nr:ABC transporter permease [Acholeplasmatales bacterium]MDD7395040.1 ABC transporter permease [Acholeplasmatales bacterium]MDY4015954.1 ABC transporter permease [Bacilli bacterium]CDD21799.1 aBC transporter permease [Firmicutes bacterium CAG:313]HCX08337.1 ABC transporter permease [Acholeplasmatales bacterium]
MLKYVLKRIVLMLFTFFVITTICFLLIKMLPQEMPTDKNLSAQIQARWEALGYNKPLLVQYGIYLKNIITKWDFGTSWYLERMKPVTEVMGKRLLPTVLVNFYSLIISIPLGILLGIIAAIRKNRWEDQVISVLIILFVSVPSYVYAFIVQYLFYSKWHIVDKPTILALDDAGGSYLTWAMFKSMIPAIVSLSFGEIAGLCRFTRAELTETLTSDYMLLARTKGLTKGQATVRHALKNAMVPILPMIISSFIGILGGSMIIEQIFAIPGVGELYIKSIQQLDYDVFMLDSIFYTFVGLLAGIVVDISYGFIDPRIRMGER